MSELAGGDTPKPGDNEVNAQISIDRVAAESLPAIERTYALLPTEQDKVVLPTLRLNRQANQNDQTEYPADNPVTRMVVAARPAVIRITGEADRPLTAAAAPGRPEGPVRVVGSGAVISSDGLIGTAAHVVRGVRNLQVHTEDGRVYRATVEEVDPATDLAIIRLKRSSPFETFRVLPLAQGQLRVNPGDSMVALGYPRGWERMYVSLGYYRATRPFRDIVERVREGLLPGENVDRSVLEVEANVQPGSSGGPLISMDGRVIGFVGLANRGGDSLAYVTPSAPMVDLLRRYNQRLSGVAAPDRGLPYTLTPGGQLRVPRLPAGLAGPQPGGFSTRSLFIGWQGRNRSAVEVISSQFRSNPTR